MRPQKLRCWLVSYWGAGGFGNYYWTSPVKWAPPPTVVEVRKGIREIIPDAVIIAMSQFGDITQEELDATIWNLNEGAGRRVD